MISQICDAAPSPPPDAVSIEDTRNIATGLVKATRPPSPPPDINSIPADSFQSINLASSSSVNAASSQKVYESSSDMSVKSSGQSAIPSPPSFPAPSPPVKTERSQTMKSQTPCLRIVTENVDTAYANDDLMLEDSPMRESSSETFDGEIRRSKSQAKTKPTSKLLRRVTKKRKQTTSLTSQLHRRSVIQPSSNGELDVNGDTDTRAISALATGVMKAKNGFMTIVDSKELESLPSSDDDLDDASNRLSQVSLTSPVLKAMDSPSTELVRTNAQPESPQKAYSVLAQASTAVTVDGTELRVEMKNSSPTLSRRAMFLRRMGLLSDNSPMPSSPLAGQVGSSGSQGIRQGKRLFTVYRVNVCSGEQQWTVHKRYSEFDNLDKLLLKNYPFLHRFLPELPQKRFLGDNMDPEFVKMRSEGLHHYIQHVFSSPVLLRSQVVRDFLCGSLAIGSISSPRPDAGELSDSENIVSATRTNSSTSSENFVLSRSPVVQRPSNGSHLKPRAVFTTSPNHANAQLTPPPPAAKSALKKSSSLRRTLKKVNWRRTLFVDDMISTTPAADIKPATGNQESTTILYASSPPEPNSELSQISIDDFYLLKLIGKGNFGKVMLAQNKENHQVYAIKVIAKASVKKKAQTSRGKPQASNPHDIDHIMAERNVLIRSASHPFLIGLRWAFQSKEKLYFVTDYVNGGEMFFHLQKERRFSELRARFYAAEIVSAMEYLHIEVDVVYRDLKPENILLDSDGHIKLTDFGLAKENFHQQSRGRTQTFCGTPEYLAPEVLRKEPYGFPVDWWCLGSVLYEMLVGLPPFYCQDVQKMFDKILNDKLKFPPFVGIRAKSIISGLLHRSPYFRLGTGDNNTSNPKNVKSHPFFEGLDWDRLYRREYTPPFVPTVAHLYDLRNIDPQFVNEPIPQSILDDSILTATVSASAVEVSGDAFQGFTFAGNGSDDFLYQDTAEDYR